MIYDTVYQTTACRGHVVQDIQNQVEQAKLLGQVQLLAEDIYAVQSGTTVNPFSHPLLIPSKPHPYLVIDTRPMMRVAESGELEVSNANAVAYQFLLNRAYLNKVWLNEAKGYVLGVSDHVIKTYARWISESVSKRFGLHAQDQAVIEVLAALFYLRLFKVESGPLAEEDKQELASKLARSLKTPTAFLKQILDRFSGSLDSVEDLVKAIQFQTESVRLKDFSVAILITMISRTWFGHQAAELLTAALEHPPTWVAVLYASLNERLYRNAGITKIAETTFKQDKKTFLLNVENLVLMAKD